MNLGFPLKSAQIVTLALALYRRHFRRNLSLVWKAWKVTFKDSKRAFAYWHTIASLTLEEVQGRPLSGQSAFERWLQQSDVIKHIERQRPGPVFWLSMVIGLAISFLWFIVAIIIWPDTVLADEGWLTTLVFLGPLVLIGPAFAVLFRWLFYIRTSIVLPLVMFSEDFSEEKLIVQQCRRLTRRNLGRLVKMEFLSSLLLGPIQLATILLYWTAFKVSRLPMLSDSPLLAMLAGFSIAIPTIMLDMSLVQPLKLTLRAIAYHDLCVRSDGIDLQMRE